MDSPIFEDFFNRAFAGQEPGVMQRHITVRTRSGRTFKYEFSEYPFSVGLTPEQALSLARRIFREKYRQSEWDRRHPQVDVEQEIVFALTDVILHYVGRLEGKKPVSPQLITSWGISFDDELIAVYPDSAKAVAEQRLNKLIARDGNRYVLRRITRVGFPQATVQENGSGADSDDSGSASIDN